MRVRIVVADQSEARFYDTEPPDRTLRPAGGLSEPRARLHDRDLASDRPGRRFERAPPAGGRRGAVAHHGTEGDGDRRPRRHVAVLFARRIAEALALEQRRGRIDRIVLMAEPKFLGMIRRALPPGLEASVAAEVPKDLVHQAEAVVRANVPPQALR